MWHATGINGSQASSIETHRRRMAQRNRLTCVRRKPVLEGRLTSFRCFSTGRKSTQFLFNGRNISLNVRYVETRNARRILSPNRKLVRRIMPWLTISAALKRARSRPLAVENLCAWFVAYVYAKHAQEYRRIGSGLFLFNHPFASV